MRRLYLCIPVIFIMFSTAGSAESMKLDLTEPGTQFVKKGRDLLVSSKWPSAICIQKKSLDIKGKRKISVKCSAKGDAGKGVFLQLWVKVNGKYFFSKGLASLKKGSFAQGSLLADFYLKDKTERAEEIAVLLVFRSAGSVVCRDFIISY